MYWKLFLKLKFTSRFKGSYIQWMTELWKLEFGRPWVRISANNLEGNGQSHARLIDFTLLARLLNIRSFVCLMLSCNVQKNVSLADQKIKSMGIVETLFIFQFFSMLGFEKKNSFRSHLYLIKSKKVPKKWICWIFKNGSCESRFCFSCERLTKQT